MDVEEAIRQKRAVRTFARHPLPKEAVQAILRAGRRAQSAKNTQPWHFIAIQERAALESLSRTGTYADHLAGAALAVALLMPDPAQRWSILFDCGQAAA
jgi:nitroreductase